MSRGRVGSLIRKGVIVVLTMAAVGSLVAWVASYTEGPWARALNQKLETDTERGVGLFVRRGETVWLLEAEKGIFSVTVAHPKSPPASAPPRFFGLRRPLLYYASDSMVGFPMSSARAPAWLLTLLLAAYPTVVFIRGPLRRYRRRKSGLCLRCGYDLRGTTSGVCSECGCKTGSVSQLGSTSVKGRDDE